MAEQNAFHIAYRSECVEIGDFRCKARHDCVPGREETTPMHSFALPRKGMFIKHVGRRDVVADANHVVFFNANEPYRVSHPIAGGDDCTVFRIAPNVMLDALAAHDPAAHDRPDRPFAVSHRPTESAAFLLHRALLAHLSRSGHDAWAVDEMVLDLFDALVARDLRDGTHPSRRRVRPATARAHAEQADEVKTVLNRCFAAPPSLNELARTVHSSPYHLVRLFKRQTGLPIHRYLNRLRLRAALDQLAEGAPNLTRLALDSGFSSHSHFSDAFRREFKLAPAAVRALGADQLRQMSKNLKADSGADS